MARLTDLLKREPVRVYLYTVATAVLALLVALGLLAGNLVPIVLGVLGAALAIPGTESLRNRVTPTE